MRPKLSEVIGKLVNVKCKVGSKFVSLRGTLKQSGSAYSLAFGDGDNGVGREGGPFAFIKFRNRDIQNIQIPESPLIPVVFLNWNHFNTGINSGEE